MADEPIKGVSVEEAKLQKSEPIEEVLTEEPSHQNDQPVKEVLTEEPSLQKDAKEPQLTNNEPVEPTECSEPESIETTPVTETGSDSEDSDLFEEYGNSDNIAVEPTDSFNYSVLDNDLFITVTEPKKHVDTMETYVSYKLTTKTTRSTFDDSEYDVYRRFNDFVWLRTQLEQENPTHLIPPLPAKFVVKSVMDRFSKEFIKTRCQALHNFMQRLSSHPILSSNSNLKTFLTATTPELSSIKKQSGGGFMSRVSGSMKSIAGSGTVKLNNRNPALVEDHQRVQEFGENMGVLIRIVERMVEEKKAYAEEQKEFAPTFGAWAASEIVINPILSSLSNCVEACAISAQACVEEEELSFLPPLREYVLYADVVKALMRKRDVIQYNYEQVVDEEKRKKEEKENLPNADQSYSLGAMMGRNAEEIREQKEKKLEQQIEQLTAKREETDKQLGVANAHLRSDLDRWSHDRMVDISQAFDDHAQVQIQYHQRCIEAWETMLPILQAESSASFESEESA